MRKLLILTFVSLAWVAPALAQDAPQPQNSAPNAVQHEDESLSEAAQSIQRNVQAQLAQAGFTDIEIVPASFLVRAKDADGNPVMLMLSPDSLSELQDTTPDDTGAQDSGASSGVTRLSLPSPLARTPSSRR